MTFASRKRQLPCSSSRKTHLKNNNDSGVVTSNNIIIGDTKDSGDECQNENSKENGKKSIATGVPEVVVSLTLSSPALTTVITKGNSRHGNAASAIDGDNEMVTDEKENKLNHKKQAGKDNNFKNDTETNNIDVVNKQTQKNNHLKEEDQKESKQRKSANASTDGVCIDTNKENFGDELDMAWICAECKEAECVIDPKADKFLICEGSCRRVFHYPCAGLRQLPPSEQEWVCNDCTYQRHSCKLCQQYGRDNEDVFKCSKDKCGNFFHESCLSMQNIEVTIVEAAQIASTSTTTKLTVPSPTEAKNFTDVSAESSTNHNKNDGGNCNGGNSNGDNDDDIQTMEEIIQSEIFENNLKQFTGVRRFTCPAHVCWTCTQEMPKGKAEENNNEEEAGEKKKQRRKKKKRKSTTQSIFSCKRETRLYQCLECPLSYHASCIPPKARFHELALLCHDHSASCKLPDLDVDTSLQASYEARVDERLRLLLEKGDKKNKAQHQTKLKETNLNIFFSGASGDRITKREKTLYEKLGVKIAGDNYGLVFCLPCDLKDEVHSKPPSYHHIHSLRYDPSNRPKRLPPTDEACSCKKFCGEECMNRALMVECFGDSAANETAGKKRRLYSNCNIGPDCGNRMLGQRKSVKCKPKREQGKGWGLIAVDGAKKGELVQEYMGEIIDEAMKEHRLIEWSKEHPNDPNFYIMSLSNGWYIDARQVANLSRFINHSCDPNCILLRINVGGYMRNGIFALRDICPGEFLSYDYHFDTKHGDKFLCRCGTAKCRGTMKNESSKSNIAGGGKKSKSLLWDEAKAQFERDKKFVQDFFERQRKVSLVSATVPGATNQDEIVANGVQNRHRKFAREQRVFLWRNAVRGSDFSNRASLMLRRCNKPQATNATSLATASTLSIHGNDNHVAASVEGVASPPPLLEKKVDLISTIFAKRDSDQNR